MSRSLRRASALRLPLPRAFGAAYTHPSSVASFRTANSLSQAPFKDNMDAFPRVLTAYSQGFAPLFRLLDDFGRYYDTNLREPSESGALGGRLEVFQPRFDVRELDDAYVLHGELAGVQKKDVDINFTDDQTLVIRGSVERSYTEGTPPAGLLEGTAPATSKATKPATKEEVPPGSTAEKAGDTGRYWVSERSVGKFSRSFVFPERVRQDTVTAELDNGILEVRVPKAKKHEKHTHRVEVA